MISELKSGASELISDTSELNLEGNYIWMKRSRGQWLKL